MTPWYKFICIIQRTIEITHRTAGVKISRIIPKFHTTDVVRNVGLAQEIATPAYHIKEDGIDKSTDDMNADMFRT